MHSDNSDSVCLHDFVATLLEHPRRWIIPMLLVSIAALAYALLRNPQWESSQSLLVRNEATGGGAPLGSFDGLDAMKNAQETVQEVATSRRVVSSALARLYADEAPGATGEPTQRQIDEALARIRIKAPQGIEFGRSEVIRIICRDSERQRAIVFNRYLGLELEAHLQQLRDRKARSLMAELGEAVELARRDLASATARLAEIEQCVGEDLSELRSLSEAFGDGGSLRARQTQLENELRQSRLAFRDMQQIHGALEAMQNEPQRLLATPASLLASQPVLQRLKLGLTEAQLQTARLQGGMSESHPLVIGARQAEAEVHARVRDELTAAIRGVEIEAELHRTRTDSIEQQLAEVRGRLRRLASLRAEYQNLVLEVGDRNATLQQAQQQLAAARFCLAAADSTSLLTRIDGPETASTPLGPGRTTIVLAGILGGLCCGLGIAFLTTSAGESERSLARRQPEGDETFSAAALPTGATNPGPANDDSPHSTPAGTTAAPKLPQSAADDLTFSGWPGHGLTWKGALFRISRITPSDN